MNWICGMNRLSGMKRIGRVSGADSARHEPAVTAKVHTYSTEAKSPEDVNGLDLPPGGADEAAPLVWPQGPPDSGGKVRVRARRRQTGQRPARTRQRIQAPRLTDSNASHNTLGGLTPRDTGKGVQSGDVNPLDDAGTRVRAPDFRVVLANVNRDCGTTGDKGQRTQCLPTRAPTHRRSPAWGTAALGVWAAAPVTPPLAGAGCPHMPAHAHARRPTRPNKPTRQPPLSGVPDAHKPPTGNGPPAQSHKATHSGRSMQSPLRSGVAQRRISHAMGPSKSSAGDWREGEISTGTGHPAPGSNDSHSSLKTRICSRYRWCAD